MDARALRRTDGVELGEVANLTCVGVVLDGHQTIVLDGGRLLDYQRGRRAAAVAFVGHAQAGEIAHHADAFAKLCPGHRLDAAVLGQSAAAMQNLGQPCRADVGCARRQWMDRHHRPPRSAGNSET